MPTNNMQHVGRKLFIKVRQPKWAYVPSRLIDPHLAKCMTRFKESLGIAVLFEIFISSYHLCLSPSVHFLHRL